jgi:hypothetical protein
MNNERRHILVGVRVNAREHARWLRAAALEDLRLPELLRESVRSHLRDLERHRLLGRGEERHPPESAA